MTLPNDAGYDTLRLLQNPRYDDQRPLAVLTVSGADDVATAFAFAQDNGLPVAIRSGGHCYPGWSAGGDPRALVLDCRRLDDVDLAGDGTATIGPGAPLVRVYDRLGSRGRAIGAGSCPTVGFGGLTLGGGVGVLTRSLGLTCDQVTSMQVVTADGTVRTASADEEPDLFFALRGGGGGHGGLVTSFTLATSAAPGLSTAYLQWPLDAAAEVVPVWQDWMAGAPAELWSTLKALGGESRAEGPVVLASVTWTGADEAFAAALARLLAQVPAPSVDVRHRRTYREAMLSYAGCADIPVDACTTGADGQLEREGFGATSHVAYDPLDDDGVADLVAQVRTAQESGLKEAGLSIDALGGVVADLDPAETAFVHRQALATVQYTATFPTGTAADADTFVRGFRAAMVPHWGESAYVNYADASLADPERAYFGDNAARLAEVRRSYDPDGFFTQPQGW
ncbi:FAD-binding oxidoreductase [soil metagenome]